MNNNDKGRRQAGTVFDMQRILAQAVRSAKEKAITALAVGVSSGAGAFGRPSGVKGGVSGSV